MFFDWDVVVTQGQLKGIVRGLESLQLTLQFIHPLISDCLVLSELVGMMGLLIVHSLLVVGFKFMHSLVCMLLKLILQRPDLIIFG